MNLLKKILNSLDLYFSKDDKVVINNLKIENTELHSNIEDLDAALDLMVIEIEKLNAIEEPIKELSVLDTFMNNNSRRIPNIAYKNKRYFKKKSISVYLNELIQRDSFEVLKIKKTIEQGTSIMRRAKSVGDKVSRILTWTDDKNLIKSGDYYVQPNEALVYKKVDCEDHAFVNASMDVEIGVVYGFMTVGDQKFGHAWNCFVHNDKLYYMETTGNTGKILIASDKQYDGRFIITKDNTYQIGAPINFGEIAK